MTVRLSTDSTSDLSESLIRRYRISRIPLNLHFGNEILKDGEDIWSEEFYHRMANEAVLLRTTPPSVEDFLQYFRATGHPEDTLISIHLSSKLSQTYKNALQAAEQLRDEMNIVVIDSGQVSMGLGWMALEGAKVAEEGEGVEKICRHILQISQHVGVFFYVDNLDLLYRTGRAGESVLPERGSYLRPILTLNDGELTPAEQFRGATKRGHHRLLELLHAKMNGRPYRVAILHADCAADAEELRRLAVTKFEASEAFVGYIGPSVGVYVGIGALGVVGLPIL